MTILLAGWGKRRSESVHIFQEVAEQKIQEAMARGEFDNLPGQGKPLVFDDDSNIPEDLRMAFKMLKNAGYCPPEVQDQKDIETILDLLEHCQDEQERYRQMQKLNVLVMKINVRRRRPVNLEEKGVYYEKIVERISVNKRLGEPS